MRKLLLLTSLLLCAAQAQARRVVSLMPSYTEIIYELGAGPDLVGRSTFCNWPPEAVKAEPAGDYLRPNLEKVYALKPDVVFTGAWAGKTTARQLASLGVKVVSLPEEKTVAEVLNTVRLIAAELGLKKEGAALAGRLSARLGAPAAAKPLKVYVEVDAGGWTAGGRTFISDAIRLAGGRNVFGAEKRGFFQATWEETLLLDPEAVILLAGTPEEFKSRPMAKDMAAVKAGRVLAWPGRDAFTRPGPRLFGEIEKLREFLHGKK